MKPTTFTWGWQQYPRQTDPKQTRQHMARLMRAWRRAKTNTGQILNKVSLVKRTAHCREYQVINTPTGEMATFTIQGAKP
jgi:hypothetical protein